MSQDVKTVPGAAPTATPVELPEDLHGVRLHFVGIKGTGMAALVEILSDRGAVITGSDVAERFYTDEILEKRGIQAKPFSTDNIDGGIRCVIYSSAYSPDKNPDLAEAARRGIPMMLYSEALGEVSARSYGCGICGVHGKTTTTGLTGTILKELDLPSQVLAGSVIASFGDRCTMTSSSFAPGTRNIFAAETCEYQRHFMAFHPRKIILTAVESDHQDYYPTYGDILKAFVEYACLLPEGGELIYCADDRGASEAAALASRKRPDITLVPYGTSVAKGGGPGAATNAAPGCYRLSFGRVEGGRQYFSIGGLGEFALQVPGRHNARNATAAVALCCRLLAEYGKNPVDYIEEIKRGLLNFRGGKRRSEIIARTKTPLGQELIVIDDYGHHPTAIATTLAGYREFYRGHKIIVDFMSHTYTRTAALLEEFASSFSSADSVIINRIYGSAREDASASPVTGEILAERASAHHKAVAYRGEFAEAAEEVYRQISAPSGADYPDGYLFVTMGAGDNWKTGTILLEKLAHVTAATAQPANGKEIQ
ncbi:MAG: UDP-N-acetylmuramate--L-alanine ligase [Treponema sp.]|nr:UDP-N-acetylmuramate--L-alanine ligase [Treponema sp.]